MVALGISLLHWQVAIAIGTILVNNTANKIIAYTV